MCVSTVSVCQSPTHTHTVLEVLWGWAVCYRGTWLVHGLAHSIRLGILFRHWTETSIALRPSFSLSLSQTVCEPKQNFYYICNKQQIIQFLFFYNKSSACLTHLISLQKCLLRQIFDHTICVCNAFTCRCTSGRHYMGCVCLLTRCHFQVKIGNEHKVIP